MSAGEQDQPEVGQAQAGQAQAGQAETGQGEAGRGASDWARQRQHAIAVHAADLARRETDDAERAGRMLLEFVHEAKRRDIAPVPLRARSRDGRHRYRTDLTGWYLRADEGLAVADDGRFYILSVAPSLRALVAGAIVVPARPRLVIGEGGRDGDRITLRALLDRILAR